jgi:hypothetical protein
MACSNAAENAGAKNNLLRNFSDLSAASTGNAYSKTARVRSNGGGETWHSPHNGVPLPEAGSGPAQRSQLEITRGSRRLQRAQQ